MLVCLDEALEIYGRCESSCVAVPTTKAAGAHLYRAGVYYQEILVGGEQVGAGGEVGGKVVRSEWGGREGTMGSEREGGMGGEEGMGRKGGSNRE